MRVTVADVKMKEVELTEVWVGSRLMYIVADDASDQFHIVDPFMVHSLGMAPNKTDALATIVQALVPRS